MARRVVITGAGVISCLGLGKESLYRGLVEGNCAFSHRSLNDPERFPAIPALYAGYIEEFSAASYLGRKGIRTLSRESQILLSAAIMACQEAGLSLESEDRESIGVFTGTTSAGLSDYVQMFTDSLIYGADRVNPAQGPQTGFNAPASQLSIHLGIEGPNLTMNTGVASGVDALSYANDYIRDSRVDVALAGGVETLSYFVAYGLMSAADGDCVQAPPRPFDLNREGPAYAEAGVVLVVEDYDRAVRRGAPYIVEISGIGSAFEPAISVAGLERASRRAILQSLGRASVAPSDIDVIFASASGDEICDASEARALWSLFAGEVPVCAVKGITGECRGASGALQVACSLLSLKQGIIPATWGYMTRDSELPPLNVTRELIEASPRRAMINCLDRSGYASTLILSATQAK